MTIYLLKESSSGYEYFPADGMSYGEVQPYLEKGWVLRQYRE